MISKKASVKAIGYTKTKTGRSLSANATWEQVFEILMEGYQLSVYSKIEGDTVIKIFKEPAEKEDLIDTITVPNSECFLPDIHDWDWAYIYKAVVEWAMRKRKSPKKIKLSPAQIQARLGELRGIIKSSKGADKRRVIAEFNDLSKMVEDKPEEPKKPAKPVGAKDELRKEANKLYHAIYNGKKAGKDVSELELKLQVIKETLKTK